MTLGISSGQLAKIEVSPKVLPEVNKSTTEIKPEKEVTTLNTKDKNDLNPLEQANNTVSNVDFVSDQPMQIASSNIPKQVAPSLNDIKKKGAVLEVGHSGESVSFIQRQLNKLGFPIKSTGTFDQATQNIVKKFQQSKFIQQTGQLGKTTLEALENASIAIKKGFQAISKFMSPDKAESYTYNQYSGLSSQNGDCGPSCVKMVLKAVSGIDSSIGSIRRSAGVTNPRGGAWAISEDEVKKSIEGLSNGRIKQMGSKDFNGSDKTNLIEYAKAELNKGRVPILMTGNNSGNGGGHYTTIVGIKDNGTLLVADSNGGKISEYSPQDLERRMKQVEAPTTVRSFEKVK